MTYKREVRVYGNLDTIWNRLTTTLSHNGYKITNTVPQKQITAERGSRIISGFVGGTKGGYREVSIGVYPTNKGTIVRFLVNFSAMGIGISYKGTRNEIDKMIQDFQYRVARDHRARRVP